MLFIYSSSFSRVDARAFYFGFPTRGLGHSRLHSDDEYACSNHGGRCGKHVQMTYILLSIGLYVPAINYVLLLL